MAKHFKYLIVGAGMMGAAAARHLSQWTDGVALLGPAEPTDPKTHEGVFASHYDEARITRTIDPDPVWARLAHRSIARYPEIAADSGVDFYSEAGCLLVGPKRAGGPSYVRDVLDAADRLGVQPEVLDGSALDTKFSCFAFP
ncbi:MAG: FAD-dependent oxidoreductase, partial [Pseudomonadota bacterium]|nr:FAD-dependent oxidoreductase [Pseudomonadota bacterium]